ncbi:MAG TPA: hypothetical protein VM100_13045 [Longimicrobiales bacterium]|nr:hypothetical protein [Longimicrobiales bacterium]
MADKTRANHLYWETEGSIAQIADKLGVSRRALYELVDPLPSGAECESCGAELYYSNRSAKVSATGRCLMCGNERVVEVESIADEYDEFHYEDPRKRQAQVAMYAVAGIALFAAGLILIRRRR